MKKVKSPEQLLKVTAKDKAMIAGFFDGDGCASITGSRRRRGNSIYYQCTIIFAQSRIDKIQHMMFILRRYRGVLYFYPKKRYMAKHAQLRICGYEALRLAQDMYSYSMIRKKQLKILQEFEEIRAKRREFGCTGSKLKVVYLEELEAKKREMHVCNRIGERRGVDFDWGRGEEWRKTVSQGLRLGGDG